MAGASVRDAREGGGGGAGRTGAECSPVSDYPQRAPTDQAEQVARNHGQQPGIELPLLLERLAARRGGRPLGGLSRELASLHRTRLLCVFFSCRMCQSNATATCG